MVYCFFAGTDNYYVYWLTNMKFALINIGHRYYRTLELFDPSNKYIWIWAVFHDAVELIINS